MINVDEIKKVARLAKLRFSEEEIIELVADLSSIMTAIDSLNELDCSNIEPLTSVCDAHSFMRQDCVEISNNVVDILSNVPAATSHTAQEIQCFVVPKMVE